MADKSPERLALETRAEELKLKVPGNIGDDKLAERIAERQASLDAAVNTPIGSGLPSENGNEGSAKNGADKKPKRKRKDDAVKGKIVKVVGPKQGRRRIGRHFGPEPVEIPVDDLSADEIAALKDDPTLAVSIS